MAITISSRKSQSSGEPSNLAQDHDRTIRSKDPRSAMLRFHTQTGGSTLTAQQPVNNVVRVAVQAMQRRWAARNRFTPTASTRHFHCRPKMRLALRFVRSRSSAMNRVSPKRLTPLLVRTVESLTDEVERLTWEYIERIDEMEARLKRLRLISSKTRLSNRHMSTRSRLTMMSE